MNEATSKAFDRLHPKICQWIWQQGWNSLRDVQEMAVGPVLDANRDLVITAATAAGKTEAAFLPAISSLLFDPPTESVGILYVSPLKALINDQTRRLQTIADLTELKVTTWHGDASVAGKHDCQKTPEGIVLITPESLESLLMKPVSWCRRGLKGLRYVIIDEFHAFIGSERGCQLQSLLHRLDFMLERKVPRIALSATLGDMNAVLRFLRPEGGFAQEILESQAEKASLKLQVRAFGSESTQTDEEGSIPPVFEHLYRVTHGHSNLIFCNSRSKTEELANAMRRTSELHGIENEYFAHHGKLSKELREGLEATLQRDERPTTAVCTSTLEMGIDIGHVDSVLQLDAPMSVASLRQRIGRAGRRGQAPLFRQILIEPEESIDSLLDRLRLNLYQSIAMIHLMLQRFIEPVNDRQLHFSTLVQQTLSVVVHYGSADALDLYRHLCETGAFAGVSPGMYRVLLASMIAHRLLEKVDRSTLVIGDLGERVTGNYKFYSAFKTPEEYTFKSKGRMIATFPIACQPPLYPGQRIIMAGRPWEVKVVDDTHRLVEMSASEKGVTLQLETFGANIHRQIREEMRRLYMSNDRPMFCDPLALDFFEKARLVFRHQGLMHEEVITFGGDTFIFSWQGDRAARTIAALLQTKRFQTRLYRGVVIVERTSRSTLIEALREIYAQGPIYEAKLALQTSSKLIEEKFDRYVPTELLAIEYGYRNFDMKEAWTWLEAFIRKAV